MIIPLNIDDFKSQNFGSIMYDISYPMKKEGDNFDNFLSGKASFYVQPKQK